MTERKWTPGPWVAHKRMDEDDPTLVISENGNVAECSSFQMGTAIGEDAANAHLIAAAPDLYEALIDAEQRLNDAKEITGLGFPRTLFTIRTALSKARGEK